jgi:hypothetical protein
MPHGSGGGRADKACTTTGEALEELWNDLPGLAVLQDLQLREVHGLHRDWEKFGYFALKSLGLSCLLSLDLRCQKTARHYFEEIYSRSQSLQNFVMFTHEKLNGSHCFMTAALGSLGVSF